MPKDTSMPNFAKTEPFWSYKVTHNMDTDFFAYQENESKIWELISIFSINNVKKDL
jgi:hypothetical protein